MKKLMFSLCICEHRTPISFTNTIKETKKISDFMLEILQNVLRREIAIVEQLFVLNIVAFVLNLFNKYYKLQHKFT